MDSIQEFCGLSKNDSYMAWDSKVSNFSYCFLWVIPSPIVHGVFILFCAYLIGLSKKRSEINGSFKENIMTKVLTVLLIVLCIIDLVLSYVLNHRAIPAYILTKVISILCWSLYLITECQSFPTFDSRKRKNYCMTIASLLVLIVSILEVYAVVKNIVYLGESIHTWPVQYYGTFLYCLLCLCIVIVSLCSWRQHSYVILLNGRERDKIKVYTNVNHNTKYKELDSDSTSSMIDISICQPVQARSGNVFSNLTLWWVNKIINKGSRDELNTTNDLFLLPKYLTTAKIRQEFSAILKKERALHKVEQEFGNHGNRRTLFGVLSRTYYGRVYYSLAIMKLTMMALDFSGPIFLNYLIKFMQNTDESIKHGYYYAAALFATSTLNVFVMGHFFYFLEEVRVYLRGSLITAIYEKTLHVSSSTLYNRFSTGQIINFMTTDVDRILESCYDFHELWGVPIQVGVCLLLLYKQVGISMLASVGIIVLFSPATWIITMKIKVLMEQMMTLKDDRVKIIAEILNGIRIIKFYAWEKHFEKVAGEARNGEMKTMKVFKYLQAFVIYFWVSSPYIMCCVTFAMYVLLGNEIDAATVFTTMSLLSILNTPLNDLPWCISGVTNAWVSLKRLDVFLSMPEIDKGYYLESSNNDVFDLKYGRFKWKDETAVEDVTKMKQLATEEEIEQEKHKKKHAKEMPIEEETIVVPFLLKDIHFSVEKGSFIGITGKVGAGKSSLFAALIAEMQKLSGILHVDKEFDGFAYVAQEAWIQNMTVKDNILYGKSFDQQKYDQVLYACALLDDLKILPAGDMTEIGENGINLSGGQKARVAFARAVYQDKAVYLMDDPLAAVDSHVASHLFKHCIMGILKDKTRILSTHHIKYLRSADSVMLMKDGYIVANGKPEDVLASDEVVQLEHRNSVEEEQEPQSAKEERDKINEQIVDTEGKLVSDEEKQTGSVGTHVYKYYIQEIGIPAAVIMFVFLAMAKSLKNTGDWWMAYWTSNIHHAANNNSTYNNTNHHATVPWYTIYPSLGYNHYAKYTAPQHIANYGGQQLKSGHVHPANDITFYLGVYCALMIGGSIGTLARTLANAYGCVRASTLIHKKLLNAIMQAPIAFFDITPIGRLTNRFSSDIYAVDSECAFYFQATASLLMQIIVAFVMACYSIPWFTAIIVPIGVIYYFIQKVYRKSSRELKRISTITRSPIYAHFSETLSGLMTIRAFRGVPRFIEQNEEKLDANQKAYFSTQVVEVWLVLRLGALGVFILTAIALLAVVEHHYQSINPGLVGLAVSISLAIQGYLLRLVTLFTRLEKGMVNTERVLHYITETEAEPTGFTQVPDEWPTTGKISFRRVSLRYRDDLPLVLNDLSLEIDPAEKIGICGRTGSGKSSLFRLLFKIIDLTSGEVIIDDVSLRDALTDKIRNGMSIIPQDPFLFDDSVSRNLDPKDEYTDEDKFDVIEKCHLAKAVQDLGGLQGNVGERGSNLSAGQKQLICLARALLKKSKVICIDEATASVDLATDSLIQQTIRTEFASSTVLTIAHRLDTIIDSDRVLVMDYGQVAEFAPPAELLSNPNSLFTALVQKDRQRDNNTKKSS